MISKCPQCGDQVSIPEGVIAEATVRCPICAAEYPLADALASAPPMLVVVDLGPSLAMAAAAPWQTDAPAAEAPVAADDLDRWLSPEPSASERQVDSDVEPVAGAIGLDDEAAADEAVDQWPAESDTGITIETEDAEHAATDEDMFALVGHADESDTAEIGEELFADSEAADAAQRESAVDESDEIGLRVEGETAAAAPSETLEADEAFAGFAAVQESKEAGATTAAKMRRKQSKRGNPLVQLIGLVGGGVVGLLLGYYVLNFFWGEQHDYLKVWLPGVAHTAKHRPTWLGGGGTPETAKAAGDEKPVTPAPTENKEPESPADTTPTNGDTGTTEPPATPGTPKTEEPKTETPEPETTPGDPFGHGAAQARDAQNDAGCDRSVRD